VEKNLSGRPVSLDKKEKKISVFLDKEENIRSKIENNIYRIIFIT
jgi:hypothetical protein